MTSNAVHQEDIFHGLPSFGDHANNLIAIVTGANGISGFHTVRVLLKSRNRWSKVYAISRRPPTDDMLNLLPLEDRQRLENIACDFLETPENIAQVLGSRGIKHVDYVFFHSYMQPPTDPGAAAWSNAEALVKANSALLENFMGALKLSSLIPKRFVLQTGGKQYGVHLGTALMPAVESDPRVTLEPNFYYPQEDAISKWCEQEGTAFNVLRPAWIIGATTNAQLNVFHAIAVYAAVQAHRNRPLAFPGDLQSWNDLAGHSSAMLTGYLAEWAALEPHTAGEAFNATDGGTFTWARFWPELARWYGIPQDQAGPPSADATYAELRMPGAPPIGYGPNVTYRYTFTLAEWARDEGNQAAWREMAAAHSLKHDPFDDTDALFPFGDAALWGPPGRVHMSTNKARMFGWNGFVDTNQAVFMALGEMSKLKMLPPMVKGVKAIGYI